MQAVPSLVGAGTAAAAAASGLVFAQVVDEPPRQRPVSALAWTSAFDYPSSRPIPTSRPTSKSISYALGADEGSSPDSSFARRMSYTSQSATATATLPRSNNHPPGPSRRHSLIHRSDWVPPPISEASRDSVSSNGSWFRRLSIRPLSQHGSPRSSIGPDSHSINFSLNSAGPILPSGSASTPHPSRNKLVKRTKDSNTGSLSRHGSRSHLPSLRRPATSHQRSATLQQLPIMDGSAFVPPMSVSYPKYSFELGSRILPATYSVAGTVTPEPPELDDEPHRRRREAMSAKLLSFFHERLTITTPYSRASSPYPTDGSPHGTSNRQPLPGRTIQTQRGPPAKVLLTKPSRLIGSPKQAAFQTARGNSDIRETVEEPEEQTSLESTPSKRPKRSISMHFNSPGSWVSRASSIRRTKRGSEHSPSSLASSSNPSQPSPSTSGGRRHVSAPIQSSLQRQQAAVQPRSVTAPADMRLHRVMDEAAYKQPGWATHRDQDVAATRSSPIPPRSSDSSRLFPGRQRNSSPIPTLSRLASFNDLRLGIALSTSEAVVASKKERDGSYVYNLPRSFPLLSRSREVSSEVPSTVAGSDSEFRAFTSSIGDDDTDFKSDTIFDSVRTVGSARIRTSDTPIESMFDESPPSTASNSKTKRLSIQEILGQPWDGDSRILEEEDEGAPTPMRMAARKSPTPAPLGARADGLLAPSPAMSRMDSSLSFAHRMCFGGVTLDDDDVDDADDDDDENDDWARIDDSGVTNNLSAPHSQQNSLRGINGLSGLGLGLQASDVDDNRSLGSRPALAAISGNISPETDAFQFQQDDGLAVDNERVRSNIFDWSEPAVQMDKIDADGHSPRPKTVHGKQELALRSGRPANRKGPAAAHVRSQSVPAIADPAEGAKSTSSKFGTWASSGPKNASEDWDDDFDFESGGGGNGATAFDDGVGDVNGKGSSVSFSMVVPASIQATQPTVRAHSGQIRELSLLVDGLKRLCRYARDLDIVGESPVLWKEAENIIALASPDEDVEGPAPMPAVQVDDSDARSDDDWSRDSLAEFDAAGVDDRYVDNGFDAETLNSFDDVFHTPQISRHSPTPPPHDMSKTAVVRERQAIRRRSVFSPDDDIFGGGWPLPDDKPLEPPDQHESDEQNETDVTDETDETDYNHQQPPRTPERQSAATDAPDSAMIESIMEAMQQQRSASAPIRKSPVKSTSTELFFNTNTLQELVKRANALFHSLSDLVRRAELLTQSPACTPRHNRHYQREDGSPAFTRVFTDPSSPSKRLPNSQSANSVLSRASPSVESPASTGISQRLQMMTVN